MSDNTRSISYGSSMSTLIWTQDGATSCPRRQDDVERLLQQNLTPRRRHTFASMQRRVPFVVAADRLSGSGNAPLGTSSGPVTAAARSSDDQARFHRVRGEVAAAGHPIRRRRFVRWMHLAVGLNQDEGK
jgi:hypothetical protein